MAKPHNFTHYGMQEWITHDITRIAIQFRVAYDLAAMADQLVVSN